MLRSPRRPSPFNSAQVRAFSAASAGWLMARSGENAPNLKSSNVISLASLSVQSQSTMIVSLSAPGYRPVLLIASRAAPESIGA